MTPTAAEQVGQAFTAGRLLDHLPPGTPALQVVLLPYGSVDVQVPPGAGDEARRATVFSHLRRLLDNARMVTGRGYPAAQGTYAGVPVFVYAPTVLPAEAEALT